MDKIRINELLVGIIKKASALIVTKANISQMNIDQFIVSMRENLTDSQISSLIENGESVVVQNEVKSAKNALDKTVKQTVTLAAQTGIEEAIDEKYKPDQLLQWIIDPTRPCPDCESRKNRIESWEDWKVLGTPRSGFSICGHYCKCRLKAIEIK